MKNQRRTQYTGHFLNLIHSLGKRGRALNVQNNDEFTEFTLRMNFSARQRGDGP